MRGAPCCLARVHGAVGPRDQLPQIVLAHFQRPRKGEEGVPGRGLALQRPEEEFAVGAVALAADQQGDAAQVRVDDVVLLAGEEAALRLKDARPIVAADFSPRRRELAALLGADVIVDPALNSPYASWQDVAAWSDPTEAPPTPPWVPGPPLRPAVIFECVGLPGVIDQIMVSAPPGARIVVVGVCMERDSFEPMFGINKELNLQFVLAYTREEFAATLRNIADGKVPVTPLITGKVGVEGVAQAFADLASPERHAKILVEPWRS